MLLVPYYESSNHPYLICIIKILQYRFFRFPTLDRAAGHHSSLHTWCSFGADAVHQYGKYVITHRLWELVVKADRIVTELHQKLARQPIQPYR